MSDDLQARVAALEDLVRRAIVLGETPLRCDYCGDIFRWLTKQERGYAVYHFLVCQKDTCRAALLAKREAECAEETAFLKRLEERAARRTR